MNFSFSKYRLFTFFGLFWAGLAFLSVILAIAGIFYKEIIIAYAILGGPFLIIVFSFSYRAILASLKFFPIFLLGLIFIFFLSQNVSPTVFSGRDQGSLAEAAILLAQNHNLYSSSPSSQEFFKIYGPGRALNFPGFDYAVDGQLTTHFPLGYISWLAAFYSVFGLSGLTIANGVSLLLFLLCFYLVARMYLSPTFSFWAFIMTASSFSFSWFFKFTLSENLALFLFWFGLWEFLLFMRRRKRLYLLAAFFSFIVLAFARIEALAVIFMMLVVLFWRYRNQKLTEKPIAKNWMAVPIVSALVIFAISIKINWPFYLNFAKGFLNSFASGASASSHPLSSYFYLVKILTIYAILPFIILAFIGFVYLLKNKKYTLFIPLIASLPVWIYLFNPSVSMDHPWMLRRFLFAVLPMSVLYSFIFLEKVIHKIAAYALLIILLAFNFYITASYFPINENKKLLSQVEEISRNFSPNDLILVDREATGDGFAMMTGPLNIFYDKQAVYFINPSDLDRIDKSKFSNVYFIIPDKNAAFYASLSDRLMLRREYRIESNILDVKTGKKQEIFSQPATLPQEKTIVTYGKIYQLK